MNNDIFVQKGVSYENQIEKLNKLLISSQFLNRIDIKRKGSNKSKEDFKIVIKINIAPASQIQYHYYTNPHIVDEVVSILKNVQYSNIILVESETNSILAHKGLNPSNIAKRLGFKNQVCNLSETESEIVEGIELSKIMLDADFIINTPKAKNHDLMYFTGCLKNLYGSIPNFNKYMLFHHKKSGFSVAQATAIVNMATPPDFNIIDWVDSVDGNERSYFKKELPSFNHYQSNRIICGENAFILDQYLALKMGYDLNKCPILTQYQERFQSINGLQPISIKDINLYGDTLDILDNWKRISETYHLKAVFQDHIPLNDKIITKGIKMYAFPILNDESNINITKIRLKGKGKIFLKNL